MSFSLVIGIFLFIAITLAISYQSAIYLMKKTKPEIFGTNVFVASMINLLLFAVATFCWFVYAWMKRESLFLNGFYLGFELFLISEACLIYTLYKRRLIIEVSLQTGSPPELWRYVHQTKVYVKQKLEEQKAG